MVACTWRSFSRWMLLANSQRVSASYRKPRFSLTSVASSDLLTRRGVISYYPGERVMRRMPESRNMRTLLRWFPAISCLLCTLIGCGSGTTSAPVVSAPAPGSPLSTTKPKFAYTANQGASLSGYSVDPSTGALTPLSGFPVAVGIESSCHHSRSSESFPDRWRQRGMHVARIRDRFDDGKAQRDQPVPLQHHDPAGCDGHRSFRNSPLSLPDRGE